MGKDWLLQINYLESVDSTQIYLKNKLKKKQLSPPCAVVANIQIAGVGSRENSWIGHEGNLFCSFALGRDTLPKDLPLESASIYFAYILKESLCNLGSQVMLKWPNDFYIDDKKIGGMITNIVVDSFICGFGLNLVSSPETFGVLDINLSKKKILGSFFKNLEKKFSWKQIFSKYELEFYCNKSFYTYNNNHKILLSECTLESDGSIINNGERIYSLR